MKRKCNFHINVFFVFLWVAALFSPQTKKKHHIFFSVSLCLCGRIFRDVWICIADTPCSIVALQTVLWTRIVALQGAPKL